jgi:hypothetical protein
MHAQVDETLPEGNLPPKKRRNRGKRGGRGMTSFSKRTVASVLTLFRGVILSLQLLPGYEYVSGLMFSPEFSGPELTEQRKIKYVRKEQIVYDALIEKRGGDPSTITSRGESRCRAIAKATVVRDETKNTVTFRAVDTVPNARMSDADLRTEFAVVVPGESGLQTGVIQRFIGRWPAKSLSKLLQLAEAIAPHVPNMSRSKAKEGVITSLFFGCGKCIDHKDQRWRYQGGHTVLSDPVSAAFTDSYLALHKLLCELQQTVARINIFAEERYQAACEVVNKGFAPAAGFEAACVQGLIAVDPIAGSHRDPNDVCPSFAVKVDETLCTCVPRAYTEQYMVFDGLCAIPWLSGDGIVWDAKRFFHCCSAPVVRRPAPNCQCSVRCWTFVSYYNKDLQRMAEPMDNLR